MTTTPDDVEKYDVEKYIEAARAAHERLAMEPGEYVVFKSKPIPTVWCNPNDRQAFIDAGIPAENLIFP